MPEEPKLNDVAQPTAAPTSRPIIVSTAPSASDNTVKQVETATATRIPISDQSGGIASPLEAAPAVIAPQSAAPAASLSEPQPVMPPSEPAPTAPGAAVASPPVPQFGELQPKVDSHPLFSGASSKPPKKHSALLKKTLWPLIALVIAAIIFYLLIDAGVIRGASHLPFHIFKQPVVATAPTITPQQTTSQTQAVTTPTNPYTGWQTFISKYQKMNLKYPSDWQLTDNTATNTSKNDLFTLKSSDGFSLSFQALVPTGAASLDTTLVSKDAITFTGQSNYLLYYSADATKNKATTGPVSSAVISTSSTKLSMPTAHTTDGSIWDVTLTPTTPIQLTDLANNADLQKAKLIIESASY